jgi:putative ABC transport system permease protein
MIRDLQPALRWLVRNPLFALAVTLILALGIGANTAVFSIVDAVLLRPLPYEASPRLVRIEETTSSRILNGVPPQDYPRLASRGDLFEKIGGHLRDFVTLTGGGEPDQISAQRVSASAFSMLGVRARLGRGLVESDDQLNAGNVAVLSDRLWRRRFHADPAVIGRPVTVSDKGYTIVGVMPTEFEFPISNDEMWMPLGPNPTGWLQVIALTKKGVGLSQVQGALEIVARQLEQENPKDKAGLKIAVSPWRSTIGRQYELTLVFILVAVGLVLLIACADVGSLLLSRAVQRQKEIAIRASLGAGFWRVVRQLLAESFVLAVLGSAAGIATAYLTLQSLLKALAALPFALPHIQRVAINERVLLFNAGLCLMLACICSLAPVLLASKVDLQAVLRGGQGAGGQRRSTRLFSILIAAEAGFAFLLLVGSGLMIRSLIRLQQSDHGFRPDHVLTMRVPVGSRTQTRPTGKYDTKPRQMAYYREIVERLTSIPGIQAVAVVNNLPLSNVNTTTFVTGPDGQPLETSTRTISGQYFSAMGIPLLAGRTFLESDQTGSTGSAQVAIINEYLARQLFSGHGAVGENLPAPDLNNIQVRIVGVVKDSPQMRYDEPAKGEVYRPYQQFIFGVFMSSVVVRTSGDPLALAATLRKVIWAVDPNQPIVKVATMNDVIADSIWRPRFSAWVFTVLGGLALLLTSAGVYAVVAYTSSLRAKEVGIRVALGATPRNVAGVILRDAMIPLTAGLIASLIAALLLSRLLTSLLYEISGTDPGTYVAAGALLLLIGAVASARPAWKAAVADPVQALRTE